MARIHIGLSGYSYKPWQGPDRFYPEGLKTAEFLRYYAGRYDTVELDGIWYRMPSEQAVRSWMSLTPSHFVFAPKANRLVTHIHRLKPDAHSAVRLMLDRLAPLVQDKRLGPVLLQLPPNLRRDDERLENFVKQLPQSVRWAMEFRHESWHAHEVESILRNHGVAWAAVETDESQAERRDTANFRYVRLRRSEYSEGALTQWADWLKADKEQGKDCFVYCKHEDEGAPWVWADRLLALTAS
ncbi:MAG TPA: DUF72 domain-containing protein [Nitrospiraceae bacterium]|nr:DUF72 domain-containing protein [Nitrospiraceae bacterium]